MVLYYPLFYPICQVFRCRLSLIFIIRKNVGPAGKQSFSQEMVLALTKSRRGYYNNTALFLGAADQSGERRTDGHRRE